MKHDARTIAVCEQLIFVHHEQKALVDLDPFAPNPDERGPNHQRYEALLAEEATLLAALTKAPAPRTLRGIKATAQVAMMFADAERSPKDGMFVPNDLVEWTTLFALTSAAGKPEAIPRPEMLPRYWPA